FLFFFFFFSSRRRHTRSKRDWSSDVCSSDLDEPVSRQNMAKGKTGVEADLIISRYWFEIHTLFCADALGQILVGRSERNLRVIQLSHNGGFSRGCFDDAGNLF